MEKKIRVEFELSPERVRELIEKGSKGPRHISNEELERLVALGIVRAGDYLDGDQVNNVSEAISGWLKKFVNKAGEKAVVTAVTKAAAEAADAAIVALLAEGGSSEPGDGPKE